MAENTKDKPFNGIAFGSESYKIVQITEKLGITFEQFAYLLDRDFYAPYINFVPSGNTLSYNDPVMGSCNFRIGQPVVYDDNGVRRISILKGTTSDGKAVWQTVGDVTSEQLDAKVDKSELTDIVDNTEYEDYF